MKNYKIAICPGHYKFQKGARVNGLIEYDETVVIADKLYTYLNDYAFCSAYFVAGSLRTKVKDINTKNFDLAIDIHLNSVTAKHVSGTETLHSGSNNSMLLAEKIQDELVACFELVDRGMKKGYFEGNNKKRLLYFLRATKCPAVIPEPLFMSNKFDLEYLDHELISKCLGLGILSYMRELEY